MLLLVLGTALFSGCSSIKLAEERDAVFAQAVEASLEGDENLAGAASWRYVSGSTEDDPRYDRALRILGESAESLGFSYAASLWYLEIAQARRDVDVVDDAVRGLERIMSNSAYDESTLLRGFVATEDLSGLPPEQMGFLLYNQGLNSLRAGLNDWAELQFSKIPEGSPYRARAAYVRAVEKVTSYKLGEAQTELEAILEADKDKKKMPEALRNDIERTLARIAFEQSRYRDAIARYETLRKTAVDDPSLLLEMAWSHYYLGEYERALGLLIALDAPAYRQLIAPERFLLEALSLRHICQFEPARNAAVRLRATYGDAIKDLYDGVPIKESSPLRRAARLRTAGKGVGEFRVLLDAERARIDELEDTLGPDFAKRLRVIYDEGIEEASRREDAELMREMQAVARELLNSEEGVRLILHELGVALLRGRRRPPGAEARLKIQDTFGEKDILYQFQGEFWTDELDDLVVTMEDRCID
ncbi:MAG: hypothetical protein R3E66_09290 [bacterium]